MYLCFLKLPIHTPSDNNIIKELFGSGSIIHSELIEYRIGQDA